MGEAANSHLRFERLIQHVLVQNLETPESDSDQRDGAISIRSGLAFARGIIQPETYAGEPDGARSGRPLRGFTDYEAISRPPSAPGVVVDGAGHCRPVYRALLVYAWLRAMEIGGFAWEMQLFPWCEALSANLPAAPAAEAAWGALCLGVAGTMFRRSDWSAMAAASFDRFVQQQQPDGALLVPSAAINPETRWYGELVMLHALSTYAVQMNDQRYRTAVVRATDFHLRETQPDHATQQPWAVFAFFSNPLTRIQAEQILHSATMQHPQSLDAVSMILLADVSWCLRNGRDSVMK